MPFERRRPQTGALRRRCFEQLSGFPERVSALSLPQAPAPGRLQVRPAAFFSCRSAHCRTSSGVRSVVFFNRDESNLGLKKLSGKLQSVGYTARYGILFRFTAAKVAADRDLTATPCPS